MKSYLLNAASAVLLAAILASSPTAAQTQTKAASERAPQFVSEMDFTDLTDRRIDVVKTALQLTAEQEKYWPAVEEAIRTRAKGRQIRLTEAAARAEKLQDLSPIEILRNRNPVEFLQRRSNILAQRAAELKKLGDAWQPLYQTLKADQKKRMALVVLYVLREMRDAAEVRMEAEEDDEG
jgi:hypothetical protein